MDEEEIDQFDENDEMFSDLSTLDQELSDDLITDSVCDTEPRINPCTQRWQHHFNEENTIPPDQSTVTFSPLESFIQLQLQLTRG